MIYFYIMKTLLTVKRKTYFNSNLLLYCWKNIIILSL